MNKEGKGLPLLYKRCTLFTLCDLVWWWGGAVVQLLQGRRTRSELWLPCALWSFALLTKTMFMSWCCCRYQQNLMGQGSVFHPGTSMRTQDRRNPTNHILQHQRGKNAWLQPDCFWQFLKVNSKLLFPPTTHISTVVYLPQLTSHKIVVRLLLTGDLGFWFNKKDFTHQHKGLFLPFHNVLRKSNNLSSFEKKYLKDYFQKHYSTLQPVQLCRSTGCIPTLLVCKYESFTQPYVYINGPGLKSQDVLCKVLSFQGQGCCF